MDVRSSNIVNVDRVQQVRLAPIFTTPQQSSKQSAKKGKRKRRYSASDDNPRSRTPSGQVLDGKVDRLRTLFANTPPINEADNFKESLNNNHGNILNPERETSQPCVHCAHDYHEHNTLSEGNQACMCDSSRDNRKTAVNSVVDLSASGVFDVDADADVDVNDKCNMPLQKDESSNCNLVSEDLSNREQQLTNHMESNPIKIPTVDQVLSSAMEKISNTASPPMSAALHDSGVIDVRLVVGMFQDLKVSVAEELKNIREDMEALATSGDVSRESKGKFKDVEKAGQILDGDNIRNKAKWKSQNFKEDVLIDTVGRLCKKVDENQQRIEQIEINNAKKMMLVTGMYLEQGNKKNARKQLTDFFNDEMGIQPVIDDFFFTGSSSPPNVVITFQSAGDKHMVYQNIASIKNLVNKDGDKLFFRDYLTSRQNASKKKERFIRNDNDNRDEDYQKEIKFKSGALLIDGKATQQVLSPEPMDILKMPMRDLNDIMDMPLNTSAKMIKQDNVFISYSIPADNLDVVGKAYMAVKLRNAAARHIVAVWNIPTDDKYDGQNFNEDEEHRVGVQMLEMLIKNNITHRSIFVARKCGEKLYADKVQCYLRMIQAIVVQAPYNPIVQKYQKVEEDYTSSTQRGDQPNGRGVPTRGGRNQSQGQGGRGGRGGRGRGRGVVQERRVYHPKDVNNKSMDTVPMEVVTTPTKSPTYVDALRKGAL